MIIVKTKLTLIATLLAVASYGADSHRLQPLEGFLDHPIGIRVQEYKGEDFKAISDQVELILIKAGAKIYEKGDYDHDLYINVTPINVDGEVVQYHINVRAGRTMEYTNLRGEKKKWALAGVSYNWGVYSKEKKREGINELVGSLITEIKGMSKKK